MFDCSYPRISFKLFKEYGWFDFFRDIKEAITNNMPESRGNEVSISMFVDPNLAGKKSTRSSKTGVLIFINKAPINWYSKRQATFEANNFGAELWATKTCMDMVEALSYKLQNFVVPIDGYSNVFCDKKAV